MRAVVWIVVCSMVKLVRLLQCCGLAVDTTRGAKSFWKNSISRTSPLRSIAARDESTTACAFSARCAAQVHGLAITRHCLDARVHSFMPQWGKVS